MNTDTDIHSNLTISNRKGTTTGTVVSVAGVAITKIRSIEIKDITPDPEMIEVVITVMAPRLDFNKDAEVIEL